jgi:hypothetical protein
MKSRVFHSDAIKYIVIRSRKPIKSVVFTIHKMFGYIVYPPKKTPGGVTCTWIQEHHQYGSRQLSNWVVSTIPRDQLQFFSASDRNESSMISMP